MGFLSSIAGFLADPIVGTIGTIATGLLGQKGANDRNEQQIALTREQMARRHSLYGNYSFSFWRRFA